MTHRPEKCVGVPPVAQRPNIRLSHKKVSTATPKTLQMGDVSLSCLRRHSLRLLVFEACKYASRMSRGINMQTLDGY